VSEHVALAPAAAGTPERAGEPRRWLLYALLVVTMLAAMVPSVGGPFIYDDVALIGGNTYVHGFEHWRGWLTGALWDTTYDPGLAREARHFWRPAVLASYAVDWTIGAGAPFVFHLTNLLLHALNVVLLFGLLAGWVQSTWAALIGALLFALHPVQTEPVAWIAGRTDSLCALGLLVATHGLRWSGQRRKLGLALVALGTLLAFGAKEAAVVLPVLALIEIWNRTRAPLDARVALRLLRDTAPFVLVSLAYLAWHRSLLPGPPEHALTLGKHALFVLEAYGRYAALVLWPDDLTLGRAWLHYDQGGLAVNEGLALLGALSLGTLLAGAWFTRRRRPELCLGLLAYVGLLLPVSGLIWRGNDVLVSPRFLYLPLLGVALALAAALAAAGRRVRLLQLVCGALLVCLGLRTFARASDFESELAFWRREIEANPYYASAQQYFVYRELNAGRPRAALELAHRWFDGTQRAGGSERQKGTLILAILAASLRVTPDVDVDGLERLQRFAAALLDSARAELVLPAQGLALTVSRNASLREHLLQHEARLQIITAEAAVRRGDDDVAILAAESAIASCDRCWRLLANAALILARAHRFERALELAERARDNAPPGEVQEIVTTVRDAMRWEKLRGSAPPAVVDAGMHSALGSFGRAYRSARSAIDNPPGDAGSVLSLAELAFRAGDVASARRLLARVLPPAQVEQELTELALSVPWLDRPRDAGEWSPGG
jgi:tetratricopeptide (TPR) repeat protein